VTKQEYRIKADEKTSLQILKHGLLLLQYLSRNSNNHMVALCENTKTGILTVERVMSFTGRNSLDVE
jgi:hypothetical protein